MAGRTPQGTPCPGHEGREHLLVAVLAGAHAGAPSRARPVGHPLRFATSRPAQEHIPVVVARPPTALLVDIQQVVAVVELGQCMVLILLGEAVQSVHPLARGLAHGLAASQQRHLLVRHGGEGAGTATQEHLTLGLGVARFKSLSLNR